MPYPKLFDNGTANVLYDADDSATPYAIAIYSETHWLGADEAVELAESILKKAGRMPAEGEGVVRASEIPFNEALLRLAAAHKRAVTFRYAKGDGSTIETRSLVPEKLVEVEDKKSGDTHMTFVGYDPDRDDVRAYRVDRMKGEVSVA
jgi:predicted DNA-binding transcriptional regulator YafY